MFRSVARDREPNMKHFLIKYRLSNGTEETWRKDIARFVAGLEADPALSGKISYRATKHREGADYYHLATAADDEAVKALGQSPFFKAYTELTRKVSGGEVEVLPLEVIAETALPI
jgi:hypothetical protein